MALRETPLRVGRLVDTLGPYLAEGLMFGTVTGLLAAIPIGLVARIHPSAIDGMIGAIAGEGALLGLAIALGAYIQDRWHGR